MSRLQQWVAGTAVVILAIVAAGWFLAIAPQKQKVSSLASQASQQEQRNSGLRTSLATLTAQMQAVPSEEAEVAAIAQKIPSDPAIPGYVRALTAAAAQAGVELVSIAPGVPTTVTVAAPSVVPTATASASPSAASPSAAASGAGAAPVAAAKLQAISVALTVQGGYFQIEEFTKALQALPRSTVLSSIALAPGTSVKQVAGASAGGSAAPSAAPSATAWKMLQASITVDVFMNSSATFTPVVAPSPAASPGAPGAATSPSPFPPAPSASQ